MSDITKAELRKKLGNIAQLQELLFGDRLEKYNHQLKQYELKLNHLENNCEKLESLLEEGLEELEHKLTQKINLAINSLTKKIKYVDITNKEEQQAIEHNLNNLDRESKSHLNYLQDSIKTQNNNLKKEIEQVKHYSEREIQLLKQQITNKLDAGLRELSAGKVSRSDLAEVLFELCLKIKEPREEVDLSERDLIQTHADLILPEDKSTEDKERVTIE